MNYIYLHGFASSPQSYKAQYLGDRFKEAQINLQIPNLNQSDFSHLTLSRQIEQVKTIFPGDREPVTIIGSSFGGLTAAWLGEKYSQVERLILLAPAFNFSEHWLSKLGEEVIQKWQQSEYFSVYHYGEKRSLPLHYQFVVDCDRYPESELKRSIPTLIFHGIYDDIIPIQASQNYARDRPWVELIELDSDHTLGEVTPEIWQKIKKFIR
jgi:pimeloyl-ACP methyl ester carboxylesterase